MFDGSRREVERVGRQGDALDHGAVVTVVRVDDSVRQVDADPDFDALVDDGLEAFLQTEFGVARTGHRLEIDVAALGRAGIDRPDGEAAVHGEVLRVCRSRPRGSRVPVRAAPNPVRRRPPRRCSPRRRRRRRPPPRRGRPAPPLTGLRFDSDGNRIGTDVLAGDFGATSATSSASTSEAGSSGTASTATCDVSAASSRRMPSTHRTDTGDHHQRGCGAEHPLRHGRRAGALATVRPRLRRVSLSGVVTAAAGRGVDAVARGHLAGAFDLGHPPPHVEGGGEVALALGERRLGRGGAEHGPHVPNVATDVECLRAGLDQRPLVGRRLAVEVCARQQRGVVRVVPVVVRNHSSSYQLMSDPLDARSHLCGSRSCAKFPT